MLECNEIRGEKKVQNTQILKSKLFFIKAKIRKLYTFSLTEALGKLLNGHASPITMLGKSAKDLAESIWNTVNEFERSFKTEAQGKSQDTTCSSII